MTLNKSKGGKKGKKGRKGAGCGGCGASCCPCGGCGCLIIFIVLIIALICGNPLAFFMPDMGFISDIIDPIGEIIGSIGCGIGGGELDPGDLAFMANNEDVMASITAVKESSEVSWPVKFKATVSSKYGYRIDPVTRENIKHTGIDLSGREIKGKPTVAIANGTVTYADPKGEYGNTVIIDHGNGLTSLYAHLDKITVVLGQTVETSEEVGLIGSTGFSTGPHLHFEVRVNNYPIDPNIFYANPQLEEKQ